MKVKILLISLSFFFLFSCENAFVSSSASSSKKLDENTCKMYINTFGALKTSHPELLDNLNRKVEINNSQGYTEFEKLIKESGFSSLEDFSAVNVKIALLYSMVLGQKSVSEFKKTAKNAKGMYDDAIAEIDQSLNDPDVPETTKAELRKTREELLKNKSMTPNYMEPKDAKPWVEEVIERFNKRSTWKISKEEFILVSKHEAELEKLYRDITLPQMINLEEE